MDFIERSAAILARITGILVLPGILPPVKLMLCGSRAVLRERCRPGADWDVLVWARSVEAVPAVKALLRAAGFTRERYDYVNLESGDAVFESWRQGGINVILTRHPFVWEATQASTEICAALNLTRREDRVAVHQIIRDRFDRTLVKGCTDVGALLELRAADDASAVGGLQQ